MSQAHKLEVHERRKLSEAVDDPITICSGSCLELTGSLVEEAGETRIEPDPL